MPRLLPTAFVFLACLLTSQLARAHLLNMTRIDVDAGSDEMLIRIEIDLGQSLMSPESYWAATRATAERQRVLLDEALQRLDRELEILIDGRPVSRTLVSFELAAISREAIENPLTPQMATLNFVASMDGGEVLQIAVAPALDIPGPVCSRSRLRMRSCPSRGCSPTWIG